MGQNKKLYWLEYTICGRFCSPILMKQPFEVVGFQTKWSSWYPDIPDVLAAEILPEIETWQPDIILFWMGPAYSKPLVGEEPPEWTATCHHIRENLNLQHTRIMAFLGFEESTLEQERAWRKQYDFHTTNHLRVIEHARIAKRLIGEEVRGFEGVNYYLVNRNGNWNIQDYLLDEEAVRDESQPDAEGEFDRVPATRLLATTSSSDYAWVANGIRAGTPTHIVYLTKSLRAWREGKLNIAEMKRLSTLASRAESGYQLLIGANETLLQAGSDGVVEVLKQAQHVGGWQVFINEHMWFEGMPGTLFNEIVYEGIKYKHWEYPFKM